MTGGAPFRVHVHIDGMPAGADQKKLRSINLARRVFEN